MKTSSKLLLIFGIAALVLIVVAAIIAGTTIA
jgi:hypothetical protein